MNRLWGTFIIIAIITMLIVMAYEFAVSLSGGNVTFSKEVNQIDATLGSSKLTKFTSLDENMPVKDADLDNK